MTNVSKQAAAIDAAPIAGAQSEGEAEQALVKDWQALFYRSLWELWDNESDTVYDSF